MSKTPRVLYDDLLVVDDQTMNWHDQPFTGVAYETDASGRVVSEAEFVDGLQSGITREWGQSGQLQSQIRYFRGARHGTAERWHGNGQLAARAEYRHSIKVSEQEWAADGSLVMEWNMPQDDPQRALLTILAKTQGEPER